jgi:hypothetical protein
MRLLISLCLLLVTGLALLRDGRTVVLVREPPAASPPAAVGQDLPEQPNERRPLRPGTDYLVLSEVALADTSSHAGETHPYPPEVMAWLAAESRRRGAEGVTCILGFYGRASGFQGSGKILRFAGP